MRSRFEREARALGALNHPNIAAIYVMELVAGSTIAEQLATGPVSLRAALSYGIWLLEQFDPPVPLWARWWR